MVSELTCLWGCELNICIHLIVNRRELVCLFSTLIGELHSWCLEFFFCFDILLLLGEVRSFQDIKDGPTSRLDVTFLDTDAAT